MRILVTFSLLLLSSTPLFSQHTVKSDEYGISFTSSEKLERYKSLFGVEIEYVNENYTVGIDVVPLEEESEEFKNDPAYGAREMAKDMAFDALVDGGTIPNIEDAYYVISAQEEHDGELVPVYILAIINRQTNMAYEVLVHCYNLNLEEGAQIVKSFSFLDKNQ